MVIYPRASKSSKEFSWNWKSTKALNNTIKFALNKILLLLLLKEFYHKGKGIPHII